MSLIKMTIVKVVKTMHICTPTSGCTIIIVITFTTTIIPVVVTTSEMITILIMNTVIDSLIPTNRGAISRSRMTALITKSIQLVARMTPIKIVSIISSTTISIQTMK